MITNLKVTSTNATDDETLGTEVKSEECSFTALAGLDEDMERASLRTNQILVANVRKTDAEVAEVFLKIRKRILNKESTLVLASHLDELGLRDAVLALVRKEMRRQE